MLLRALTQPQAQLSRAQILVEGVLPPRLLAQAYRHARFATPLGVPVEDPYGPVGDWCPYASWPPGFTRAPMSPAPPRR